MDERCVQLSLSKGDFSKAVFQKSPKEIDLNGTTLRAFLETKRLTHCGASGVVAEAWGQASLPQTRINNGIQG